MNDGFYFEGMCLNKRRLKHVAHMREKTRRRLTRAMYTFGRTIVNWEANEPLKTTKAETITVNEQDQNVIPNFLSSVLPSIGEIIRISYLHATPRHGKIIDCIFQHCSGTKQLGPNDGCFFWVFFSFNSHRSACHMWKSLESTCSSKQKPWMQCNMYEKKFTTISPYWQ